MKIIMYFLEKNGCIDGSNKKIIEFGLKRFLGCVEEFLLVFVISEIYGIVVAGFFFQISYILLRKYAGGYHAPTPKICCFISIVCTVVCLSSIRFMNIPRSLIVVADIFSWIGIYLNAPVESINKPLNQNERNKYRNKARIIATVEFIICVFLYHFNNFCYKAFGINLFIVFVGIELAKFKVLFNQEKIICNIRMKKE